MEGEAEMKRQGNTGVWTYLSKSKCALGHDTVIALSEWGTRYEFHKEQWEALPVIEAGQK